MGMNRDLQVSLGSLTLKNPVIPASGCFGFGYVMAPYYDLNTLGAISVKGTTLDARFGNPLPRVAECPSGMINSVGLMNPGVDKVISDELPKLRDVYNGPIIANISGFSVDEYCETCRRMDGQPQVDILELNVSCPNVHGGGMAFGIRPESVREVTRISKAALKKTPLMVKLSPNVESVAANARAAEEGGADAVSLVNTFTGMAIDIERRRPVLANNTGGVSGAGIKPIAVRMVFEAAHAVKIPVVGMGGITCAEDAVEFLLAGAVAVQVGTANFTDTSACPKIIDGLDAWCDAHGVKNIGELTGALKLN